MDLEVRHLRLVVEVAAHGSLTAAADRLNLTQSALSHQLRDIEERLGTPLFLRRNRHMLPTPAGHTLLESATRLLGEMERTENAVKELARSGQGLLRVATECYTCYHWLPGLLREFEQRCPGVDVQIDVDATSRPAAALVSGTLDLALMTSPVRDRRLAASPLFRDEMLLVTSGTHRFASRPFVHAADLADETLLLYCPREESYVFQRLLAPAGITPRRVQQVQLTEAMVQLVRAGLGVAVLSRWAVEPYLDSSLAGIRLTPRGFYRGWFAVAPRGLARVPYVTEFIRLVAANAPVLRKDVTLRPVLRPVRAIGA